MVIIDITKPLLGTTVRKKLGRRYGYGAAMFAESLFGGEGLFAWLAGFGKSYFAVSYFGDDDELTGIYRTDNVTGEILHYREPFYIPKNPRSGPQQTHRAKYGAAVGAWRILPLPQKLEYNQKAMGHKMSGYNFFLKEYIIQL